MPRTCAEKNMKATIVEQPDFPLTLLVNLGKYLARSVIQCGKHWQGL